MKKLKTFKIFLEDNEPQTYLDSLKQKKEKENKPNDKPTDEVDGLLQNTEEQKDKIIAKKDAIEKGLLNNIQDLEPDNQKEVKKQVDDYRDQAKEFDKTVKQIDQLNQKLKKSNTGQPVTTQDKMKRARQQNNL
jgi:hypothetical protein